MQDKKCKKCGMLQKKEAIFCTCCGNKFEEESAVKKFCTNCGSVLAEDALFCGECGQKCKEAISPSSHYIERQLYVGDDGQLTSNKKRQRIKVIGILVLSIVILLLGALVLRYTLTNYFINQGESLVQEEQEDIEEENEDDVGEKIEVSGIEIESPIVEENESELEIFILEDLNYNEISELYCGTTSAGIHCLENATKDWRWFYQKDEEYLMGGCIQSYDGNEDTIFIYMQGNYYCYKNIQSYSENEVTLYNIETGTTVKMEYISDDEFKWLENGVEQYYVKYSELTQSEELILTESELDAEILQIREWYYFTQDKIAEGEYEEYSRGNGGVFYDGNTSSLPTKVVIPAGIHGVDYTREYYFSDESSNSIYFIFAYNSESEEHRIYIQPDGSYVIRYIYNETIYNLGDEIPEEMEWLKDFFYNEALDCVPC